MRKSTANKRKDRNDPHDHIDEDQRHNDLYFKFISHRPFLLFVDG